jgi:hypothetical protein
LVAASDGSAGLATSYTKQITDILGVASQGVGGIAGFQVTASTIQAVLEGYSLNLEGLAANRIGAGGDMTFSPGNTLDMGLTGTIGVGFEGHGHAGSLTPTIVKPFLFIFGRAVDAFRKK